MTTRVVVIVGITGRIVGELSNFLLGGILFAMLGESRVGGLIEHEVLRLDQDQIAQKGREEK